MALDIRTVSELDDYLENSEETLSALTFFEVSRHFEKTIKIDGEDQTAEWYESRKIDYSNLSHSIAVHLSLDGVSKDVIEKLSSKFDNIGTKMEYVGITNTELFNGKTDNRVMLYNPFDNTLTLRTASYGETYTYVKVENNVSTIVGDFTWLKTGKTTPLGAWVKLASDAPKYASKADFGQLSSSLKPMAFMSYQIVSKLPANPDANTFYFLSSQS